MIVIIVILKLLIYITIFDAILSYVPSLNKQGWAKGIRKLVSFYLNPLRKFFPKNLPIDPTHLIVIVIIQSIVSLL